VALLVAGRVEDRRTAAFGVPTTPGGGLVGLDRDRPDAPATQADRPRRGAPRSPSKTAMNAECPRTARRSSASSAGAPPCQPVVTQAAPLPAPASGMALGRGQSQAKRSREHRTTREPRPAPHAPGPAGVPALVGPLTGGVVDLDMVDPPDQDQDLVHTGYTRHSQTSNGCQRST
jgi:hypothetical protein